MAGDRSIYAPSTLETQVQVAGVDKGTTDDTNKGSTDGQNPVRLVWQVVEGLEGVGSETINIMIGAVTVSPVMFLVGARRVAW